MRRVGQSRRAIIRHRQRKGRGRMIRAIIRMTMRYSHSQTSRIMMINQPRRPQRRRSQRGLVVPADQWI